MPLVVVVVLVAVELHAVALLETIFEETDSGHGIAGLNDRPRL